MSISQTRFLSTSASDTVDHRGAVELLTQGHRVLGFLFSAFDEAEVEQRRNLATQICEGVAAHVRMEAEILYPAARDALCDESVDVVEEGLVEHRTLTVLVDDVRKSTLEDDLFCARIKVLGEQLAHHTAKEEQQLFPKIRTSELDLIALGKQLSELHVRLVGGRVPEAMIDSASRRGGI
jgi:hemerythrin superfamily protein